MKVTLSSNLRRALIAVLATTAFTTANATIYDWIGKAGDANMNTVANYSPSDAVATAWSTGAGGTLSSTTLNNILRFSSASKDATYKAAVIIYNNHSFGGLLVEAGVTGFSLNPSANSARTLVCRGASTADAAAIGGVDGKFNLIAKEDFNLGTSALRYYYNQSVTLYASMVFISDANFDIATGKTVTMYLASKLQGQTSTKTLDVKGGGTLCIDFALSGTTNATASTTNIAWNIFGNSTLKMVTVGGATDASMIGSGAITLNSGTIQLGNYNVTMANAITVGAGGGTIKGASSVTLSGTVTATANSSLNLESNTTFTQNAVLYNVAMAKDKSITLNGATNTISGNAVLYDVNLGTGATIVLSGAANSIANVNGAAGLGNTVSLAAGITTLTGTANTTFAVASGATFILDSSYISGAHTALAEASVGAINAANGAIINVCLTEAFMANFVDADLKTFDLTTLTLQGLNIAGTITINLVTESGYMFGDQTSLTFNNVAAVGGQAVLSGIALTYVPEPTTATLGVLGLAGLLLRRRRATR